MSPDSTALNKSEPVKRGEKRREDISYIRKNSLEKGIPEGSVGGSGGGGELVCGSHGMCTVLVGSTAILGGYPRTTGGYPCTIGGG